MNTVIRNILTSLLALLIVSSTMSFTVHKHICGAFLQDVSLLIPSDGCDMEAEGAASCETIKSTKKCCNDLVEIVKGQDELKISSYDFHITAPFYAVLLALNLNEVGTVTSYKVSTYKNYKPPLVVIDIPVLFQSFLI